MRVKNIIKDIKSLGLTGYEIAKETELTEVGINKIINGSSKNPRDKTLEILEEYITKYKTNSYAINDSFDVVNESNEIKKKGVPYYDVDFVASFLEVENNQSSQPTSYIDHPFFKGCDYVVRASGQSMAKVICHGDAIGLVRINNWQDFFPYGEIYAIVTKDGFRMIKVITKGENENTYTLVSKPTDNKKDEFPSQQIKKDSILQLFKVQASSHLF